MKLGMLVLVISMSLTMMQSSAEANASAAKSISGSPHLDRIVQMVSSRYGVDPMLVHAMIRRESDYDVHAVSPKGAQGLMQLMPVTQRELGVTNPFDPWQNVDGGVRYVLQQLLYFDSLDRALAAYNAGPQREKEHQRPLETRLYVRRVKSEFLQLKKDYPE